MKVKTYIDELINEKNIKEPYEVVETDSGKHIAGAQSQDQAVAIMLSIEAKDKEEGSYKKNKYTIKKKGR